MKKNNDNWNEYGGNIPNKENSKCPETTSNIANAFKTFILSENIATQPIPFYYPALNPAIKLGTVQPLNV